MLSFAFSKIHVQINGMQQTTTEDAWRRGFYLAEVKLPP
jgi:hypothetical protein